MYKFYVLKVIFRINARASFIGSAGHTNCKNRTVDTCFFLQNKQFFVRLFSWPVLGRHCHICAILHPITHHITQCGLRYHHILSTMHAVLHIGGNFITIFFYKRGMFHIYIYLCFIYIRSYG